MVCVVLSVVLLLFVYGFMVLILWFACVWDDLHVTSFAGCVCCFDNCGWCFYLVYCLFLGLWIDLLVLGI